MTKTACEPTISSPKGYLAAHPFTPTITLVLGAGGAKGIAHLGVLEVLHKAKIPIDLIVGCSMGALIGAFYADGHLPEHIFERTLCLMPGLKSYQLFGFPSLYHGFAGKGFFSTKRMRKILMKELSAKTFEELKIPLQVVATDLEEGNLVTFGSGSLFDPICASAALPGLLQPVEINNKPYVDGGVISELPVQVAKKRGSQVIIASNAKGWINIKAKKKIGNVSVRSYYIMRHHFDKIREKNADIVIRPDLSGVMNTIFSTKEVMTEVYRRGKECAEKQLPAIKALLAKSKLKTANP
ncbi:MAG: patatin-like phospholipase family protein [Bacteroidota bacterium]